MITAAIHFDVYSGSDPAAVKNIFMLRKNILLCSFHGNFPLRLVKKKKLKLKLETSLLQENFL